MKFFSLIIGITLSATSVGFSQGTELFYDNDTFTGYQEAVEDRVFAVRMSPSGACEVVSMKFFVDKQGVAQSGFLCDLYAWEDTKPAIENVYRKASAALLPEWKEISVDEVIAFDGDFVVGYKPNDASASLAYDSSLQNDRNWVLDMTNQTWSEETAHSFLIRTTVQYTSTGIIEELQGELIKIYPNPATDVLSVEVGEKVHQISMFNSNGKVVLITNEIEPGIKLIDTSTFKSGLYLLQIDSENGSIMRKVIINN